MLFCQFTCIYGNYSAKQSHSFQRSAHKPSSKIWMRTHTFRLVTSKLRIQFHSTPIPLMYKVLWPSLNNCTIFHQQLCWNELKVAGQRWHTCHWFGGLHTVGFGGLIAIFGSSVIIPWYNNLKPKELEFVNFISVTAKASWRSHLDGIKSRLIPNLLSIFFHRWKFIVASEIQ